jgi:hypothetical protein
LRQGFIEDELIFMRPTERAGIRRTIAVMKVSTGRAFPFFIDLFLPLKMKRFTAEGAENAEKI